MNLTRVGSEQKEVEMKILVINGPNLNLLGRREPGIYGSQTLESINSALAEDATGLGASLSFFQSNSEGEIVDAIQRAVGAFLGIIINPAAYTHTSVAIRDAISAVSIPAVEVHLSNVYSREEFRHKSLIAPVVLGQIAGFGPSGYKLALMGLIEHLKNC
jgi:3-dehydroquinate dehydratase-2